MRMEGNEGGRGEVERKVRARDTILRGRWMQRFRAMLHERPGFSPSGVRAEVLELKIHYLCFCAETGEYLCPCSASRRGENRRDFHSQFLDVSEIEHCSRKDDTIED